MSRQQADDGNRRWTIGAAIAVLAGGAVVALVVATGGAVDDEPPSTAAGTVIAHVHGLGIDPADDELQVATHFGLFELSADGRAERVSDDPHDFMGFTVAGPDRFLASGHPAPGSSAFDDLDRPLFGLIESTDGGRSWKPVSLSGEVDFHALTTAHGRIYGFDATSGRFMVSADGGQEWDVRASVAMADLAVDPADPDRIIASTRSGVAESTDGGRSWRPLDDAPPLVFLSWHPERGLWGLDGEGTVHRFAEGTWEPQHELRGAPQALLVHDGGVVAAVDDGSTAIHASDGDGRWGLLHRDEAGR